MFRNPQDEQNSKLPLELNFEQDFNEKNGKTSATSEIAGTVFIVYLCDLHQSRANDPNFHILSLYLVMMGYLFHKMQINQCYSCVSSVCCVTVGQ